MLLAPVFFVRLYARCRNPNYGGGGRAFGLLRHRYLLLLWTALFGASFFFITKTRRRLNFITSYVNTIAVFLIILPLSFIIIARFDINKHTPTIDDVSSAFISGQYIEKQALPDIPYIILDGYARADILQDYFAYNNYEFLEYLKSKGFFIASESTSNYTSTVLSLASSLNMEHLLGVAEQMGQDSADRRIIYQMLRNSKVLNFLKSYGYTTIQFNSGMAGADRSLSIDKEIFCGGLSEFNETLIRTTMLRPFVRLIRDSSRERILCIFSRLPQISQQYQGLKFVFAHIIVPHPPYLFKSNGDEPNNALDAGLGNSMLWKDKQAYIEQLKFVNKETKRTIDALLAMSPRPPIIILQSDHGPASTDEWESPSPRMLKERMSILNAFLFPVQDTIPVYASITPVNTFRVIFNRYFKTEYDILDDNNYWSVLAKPYNFTNVTEVVRQ